MGIYEGFLLKYYEEWLIDSVIEKAISRLVLAFVVVEGLAN